MKKKRVNRRHDLIWTNLVSDKQMSKSSPLIQMDEFGERNRRDKMVYVGEFGQRNRDVKIVAMNS